MVRRRLDAYEPKLRTSIVEGISVFLSLFDDNPKVKYTFCPPKATYDPVHNPDGRHGVPLPPLADLIEQGKVVALNFPVAMNPGLARALGTMLKQDFQRAVLNRMSKMQAEPTRLARRRVRVRPVPVLATTGENGRPATEVFPWPAGALISRSSHAEHQLAKSNSRESWRTLQGLRTKIFLR